jgi:hypothetical protein
METKVRAGNRSSETGIDMKKGNPAKSLCSM